MLNIILVVSLQIDTDIVMQWFNDVYCPDISAKCEDALNLLSDTFGCKVSLSLHAFCEQLFSICLRRLYRADFSQGDTDVCFFFFPTRQ